MATTTDREKLEINKGIALRPVANIDNDLIYSNGDVINQEEENLTLIRES